MTSCYIVDKSVSGTKKLTGLISQKPELVLINTHVDLEQAIIELDRAIILPHILFVALDNSNNYELLIQSNILKSVTLVIVGSSDRFYKDAFILEAAAYLPKPLMEQNFNNVIERCKDKLQGELEKNTPGKRDSILIRTGPCSGARIDFHRLLYVENLKKRTLWHVAYEEPIRTPLLNIASIKAIFYPNMLHQISENRIVNLAHIVATDDEKILLRSGEWMEVRPDYKEDFFNLMEQTSEYVLIPYLKRPGSKTTGNL